MIRCAILLLAGILLVGTHVSAQTQTPAGKFSQAQVRRILGHGPWPHAWRPDPSNRASGQTAAIELGRRLFFDARLSPSGRFSCSSCHRPERGWTDGRPRGIGLQPGWRNTPSLFNVRLNRWFGWSGAGDSLWAQSLRPILDPDEMGSDAGHVRAHIASDEDLARAYETAFGHPISATDAETALVDAAKALAAYQETIVSGRTTFDAFRDALYARNAPAVARYPLPAQRGLAIFIGKGGCSACHAGPAFANGAFYDIGHGCGALAPTSDAGRSAGIAKLVASPYNLAGRFNDDPKRQRAPILRQLTSAKTQANAGAFKVPSLRNLKATAPYLHDGSCTSLSEAIRAHAGARALSDHEIALLVQFLETLSEPEPPSTR